MLPRGTENGVKDQRIFCLLFIFFYFLFPFRKVTASFKMGDSVTGNIHARKEKLGFNARSDRHTQYTPNVLMVIYST
jgi:hypothetical protein